MMLPLWEKVQKCSNCHVRINTTVTYITSSTLYDGNVFTACCWWWWSHFLLRCVSSSHLSWTLFYTLRYMWAHQPTSHNRRKGPPPQEEEIIDVCCCFFVSLFLLDLPSTGRCYNGEKQAAILLFLADTFSFNFESDYVHWDGIIVFRWRVRSYEVLGLGTGTISHGFNQKHICLVRRCSSSPRIEINGQLPTTSVSKGLWGVVTLPRNKPVGHRALVRFHPLIFQKRRSNTHS